MLKRGLTEEEAHWQYLLLLARHIPGKSFGDCDHCLKYMERQRACHSPVAFPSSSKWYSITPARPGADLPGPQWQRQASCGWQDCLKLVCVVEIVRIASRTSSAVEKSGICSLRAKHHVIGPEVMLLELFESWKYCSNTVEIRYKSLQKRQSTFLNDLTLLTDTMLDVCNLLSLPVHYGLELCV